MSEHTPLISVIVPVYKVEPYLDRCVQSIVDQTYTNLEIILVDDGSPDNCPAMCDAWAAKDSRIRVIHKANGGLSDARNAGMAIAKGEYIGFVDSDDWISEDYIDYLYRAVVERNADISACDIRIVYEMSSAEHSAFNCERYTAEQALDTLTRGETFRAVAWNKLYRRDLLEGERFPVGRYHEDEFFTYRILAKAERLSYVDCGLYFYFQRQGSIMNSVSLKHLDTLDAYLERIAFWETHYPGLLLRDKVMFCHVCVNLVSDFGEGSAADIAKIKKHIVSKRSSIFFSLREIISCGLKDIIYVFGSRFFLSSLARLSRGRRLTKG